MGLLLNVECVYDRLQDEYAHMEEEIKRTVEESKIVQEKYKTMYEQARRELGEKSAQMEEIRSSVSNSWEYSVSYSMMYGECMILKK